MKVTRDASPATYNTPPPVLHSPSEQCAAAQALAATMPDNPGEAQLDGRRPKSVEGHRAFAVEFYTDAGILDPVGNNIPVFFIQDAMKFPDLVHAVKPEPHNGMPQYAAAHDTFWEYASLMPETTHTLMWGMSDRGTPRILRMMHGFGVHTYRLVKAKGESHFDSRPWRPFGLAHRIGPVVRRRRTDGGVRSTSELRFADYNTRKPSFSATRKQRLAMNLVGA